MSEIKRDVDLQHKVKFQTQFHPAVGDIDGDGDHDYKDELIACCAASKLMIKVAGFETVNGNKRIDAVVFDKAEKLVKADTFDAAVKQLHQNCDEGKPTLVGVNRGKKVGNANPATSHFIVIIGRKYNKEKGVYEYHFYDPGTRNSKLGTDASNILSLNKTTGFWEGVSAYLKEKGTKYTVTEIRPTLD